MLMNHPFLYIENPKINHPSKKPIKPRLIDWKYSDGNNMNIFECIDNGFYATIPGDFNICKETGKYRHMGGLWKGTWLIAFDGDYFKYKCPETGEIKNPNAEIEAFQLPPQGLNLLGGVPIFAMGASPTALSNKKPHMRYRIWVYMKYKVIDRQEYHKIQDYCYSKIKFLDPKRRQPAQPVYGNACSYIDPSTGQQNNWTTEIIGEVLDNYKVEESNAKSKLKQLRNKKYNLQNRLNGKSNNNYTKTDFHDHITFGDFCIKEFGINVVGSWKSTTGGMAMQIDCPWYEDHNNDAYLFYGDNGAFAVNCHHTTCKDENNGFKNLLRSCKSERKRSS